MTPRKPGVRKVHQTWWGDLQGWIDNLYEDHHALVGVAVSCAPSVSGITWAVVVEVRRIPSAGEPTLLWRNWRSFNPNDTGAAEAAALHLVSRATLDLDNERAAAAAPSLPLWA